MTPLVEVNQYNIGQGDYLEFEAVVAKIDKQIAELTELSAAKGIDYSAEIRNLQKQQVLELKKIYSTLNAWQTVQVARHPKRPLLDDYLNLIVKDFHELHGDRLFGDDNAIVTGLGTIGYQKVMIIGQNKGRTTKQKIACNFGCPNPEGYRKALAKMKLAAKFGIPIVTFIDTPGAYPGVGAEERGQAQAIATNLMEMARLQVPIISIVIGEGGSGGALGIGVADEMAMLEFAYYSVISPEGCAAILWRDGSQAPSAAEALKLTSKDLQRLQLIDHVIDEPLGGAHRNLYNAVYNVEHFIVQAIRGLKKVKVSDLVEKRYQKLMAIGSAGRENLDKKAVNKTTPAIKEIPAKAPKAAKKPNIRTR